MGMRGRLAQARRGAALVVVLPLLILLTFLVVAFFSRAVVERQVSASSTAREQAGLLARSAAEEIIHDLFDEMRYGNAADDLAGNPLGAEERLTRSFPASAERVAPHRVLGPNEGQANTFNLVKMSLDGRPLYPEASFPDGPPDGAKIAARGGSTATPSRNGRAISAARWNQLALLPSPAGFTPPDWIRITRTGPERLGDNLPMTEARDHDADGYVIGRYAFLIANLGGMLDVNLLGNGFPVDDDRNAARRRAHQADFTAIRGPADPPLDEDELRRRLVDWRWGAKASDEAWLMDPGRSFLEVESGQNLIFSRNELLSFQQRHSDVLNFSDLAYLTVGSYERNVPAFDQENHNAAGAAKPENQSIARIRYTAGAKQGERVLSRRFPLQRLDLLSGGGNAAEIEKHFGLRRLGSDDWQYVGTAPSGPGFIRTLDDLAADPANPEPNFFEILKAVINQNTLGIDQDSGKFGGWTVPLEQGRTPDYQIFKIGANIIDQWDANDDPTRIQSGIGDDVWGIENLPYINQMFQWHSSVPRDSHPDFPTPGRRFNTWFVPEMWNPHRNAAAATATRFRIVGIGGVSVELNSQQGSTGTLETNASSIDLAKSSVEFGITQALGSSYFAEPTLIREGIPQVEPGAGTNDSDGEADTAAQAGPNDTQFLGLWAGSTNIPEGHDRVAGNGLHLNGAPSFGFELQYLRNGVWRTYQRLERFKQGIARSTLSGAGRSAFTSLWPVGAITLSDPRCHRATRSYDSLLTFGGVGGAENARFRFTWVGRPPASPPGSYGPFNPANLFHSDDKLCGTVTPETSIGGTGMGDQPGLIASEAFSVLRPVTLGAAWNTHQPIGGRRWTLKDRDNQVRFADAAALPLNPDYATANQGKGPLTSPAPAVPGPHRPIVLNRSFRSVGELGYVSRDQPWKTLNFSLVPYQPDAAATPELSGDSGLLEVFTLDEAEEVAGKVDLNTRNARVLECLLRSAESWRAGPAAPPVRLSDGDAAAIAANMAAATAARPVPNAAGLATYVTASAATNARAAYNDAHWIFPEVSAEGISKDQLEAPLRALAALGTTRTWNLGVDLIVQVGRYPPDAADPARDFIVESQQRYFLTLVFDRFDGTLVRRQMEPIYE